MAPSVPLASVREILESRLSKLVLELESAFEAQLSVQVAAEVQQRIDALVAQATAEGQDRGRGELAEAMNQAARRLRHAPDAAELGATLVELAAVFCAGVLLLRVNHGVARGDHARGIPDADVARRLEIPLNAAAALAEALRTKDPVTTITTAAEVSFPLAKLNGQGEQGRASIYPVVVGERVPALLYAWGIAHGAALELLAQLAGAVWANLPPPTDLLSIGAAPQAAAAAAWDTLPAEEQRIHLRAQRFARVQVAEMRLYETDAVQSGRAQRDLYTALRSRIDTAREAFHKQFFSPCPSMVDYLHLEMLRTLANEDPAALGKEYPGPMV